jgi:transaldolase/glucose-6-phosphate isomerase
MSLEMPDVTHIGAEFLRWEVATAAAGVLLEINPFDEPNVTQAKEAARALLDRFEQQGRLPFPESQAAVAGARLSLSAAAQEQLGGRPATDFLALLQPGDYFGLMAYLPPDGPVFGEPLHALRTGVADRTGCATMFGYGPRYLHSTGQLHKGGANNGVFIVITADAAEDLAIPGERFSFGVLEMAQAIGDFQSLDRTGRRALLVHLPGRDPALLKTMATTLLAAR